MLFRGGTLGMCMRVLMTQALGSNRMLPAGGHIAHVASALGQLDILASEGIKAYIRGAKSVQELVDMPYPAEELAKVCAVRPVSTANVTARPVVSVPLLTCT